MNVALLDRDGTIIVDPPDERVDRVEKIELFPDTIEALGYLATNDFGIIIITNQAGIAEGRITEDEFWKIHHVVLEKIAASGVQVIKTFMSPHGSNEVNEWRKPGPGMLLAAAKEFDLNLENTYMVGDSASDIKAGIAAGSKTILVKTGNTDVSAPEATYTAPSLMDAVTYLVKA
jgi:histidinol-phosphate phosphatase family protein